MARSRPAVISSEMPSRTGCKAPGRRAMMLMSGSPVRENSCCMVLMAVMKPAMSGRFNS